MKQSENSIVSQLVLRKKQSYAPFGSVSPKSMKKKNGEVKQKLGPGSYDISFPIIKPLIQTIKKKNNNIIVKLTHLGTSSFQGDNQRFSDEPAHNQLYQIIGPGKYSPQKSIAFLQNSRIEKHYQRPKRKSAGTELARFIKNRQKRAATFSQVKNISIEDYIDMPLASEKQLAPPTVNANNKGKIKGSAWSMMKQKRIKDIKNPYQNIGPGQYYIDDFAKRPKLKKLQGISEEYSAFKSQSVRSFFDSIRFQTNQEAKALMREADGYKSSSVGPGAYDFSKKKSTEKSRFQFFGSTVERTPIVY